MANYKTFQTIEEAAAYISSRANTGNERTVNDVICFGIGVYAYKDECKAASIVVDNNSSCFQHLNRTELLTLLTWLQNNDGYLTAC